MDFYREIEMVYGVLSFGMWHKSRISLRLSYLRRKKHGAYPLGAQWLFFGEACTDLGGTRFMPTELWGVQNYFHHKIDLKI
jgi:hypothetical protein